MTDPNRRGPRPETIAEREWLAALRGAARGSGWGQKQGALFRQEGAWFVAGHLRMLTTPDGPRPHAEILAKPMALDPLYWRDMSLSENARQPLSFRYWGAFVCGTPVLDVRALPADGDAEARAAALIAALDAMLPDLMVRLAEVPFSTLAADPKGAHDNWRMGQTLLYAHELERNGPALRAQAERMAEGDQGGPMVVVNIAPGVAETRLLAETVLDRLDADAARPAACRAWWQRLFGHHDGA